MKATQVGRGDLTQWGKKKKAKIQRKAFEAANKMERLVQQGVRITTDLNTTSNNPVINALKKTVEKDGELL